METTVKLDKEQLLDLIEVEKIDSNSWYNELYYGIQEGKGDVDVLAYADELVDRANQFAKAVRQILKSSKV